MVPDVFEVEPALSPDHEVLFEPFRPDGLEEAAPAPPTPPAKLRLSPRAHRPRAASPLPSEPALFAWLARRLSPGEATLWTGPRVAVEPILELLYAGSALARGRISLLEGANRFHPYCIGELGRSFGLDA